jgi:arabinan endo-1,5-alpha-L-arabinosidase
MARRLYCILFFTGALYLVNSGCGILSSKESALSSFAEIYYTNPILDTVLADPTVVLDPNSGYFYAYGTEDNWGDGLGSRLIPIVRSKDLVNWTLVGNAFERKPTWKEKGGLWAPDINRIGKEYYLYYSFSTWGDPNPGIGLAIASSPEGPFIDQGKLFYSKEVDVPNSIDPFYFEDNGKKYLFWGSFSDAGTQGTYGVELSADGRSVPDFNKKFKIAAGDFEAVMIHKKDGFYYFFGSKGSCCEGVASKYNVRIARSSTLKGPFLDKNGDAISQRGNGTLFMQGNDKFVGPGHNAQLITDDQGTDWFIYHAIDINNGKVSSGASRRVLLMDQVIWENGWPKVMGEVPSTIKKQGPAFK